MKKNISLGLVIGICLIVVLNGFSMAQISDDYTLDTINQRISNLSTNYAKVSDDIIGYSVLGNPIKVIKIGTGDIHYLFSSGLHARENINPVITLWMAEHLVKNRSDHLKNITLHIIPLVNPDGYDLALNPKNHSIFGDNWEGADLKSNYNGIDLNRNFPTKINGSRVEGTPGLEGYPGLSIEPETKALINYMDLYDFSAYVDLHSRGECIYWDNAYSPTEKRQAESRLVSNLTKILGYYKMPAVSKSKKSYSFGYATDYFTYFKSEHAFTLETGDIYTKLPTKDDDRFNKAFQQIKDLSVYLHEYLDETNQTLRIENKSQVPILMYDSLFKNNLENEVLVIEEKIRNDITYLKKEGYDFITLETLGTSKKLPEKPIIITITNCSDYIYSTLFPLLEELNVEVSVALQRSDFVLDSKDRNELILTKEQVSEMSESGFIDFQNYTYNSYDLNRMSNGLGILDEELVNNYMIRIKKELILGHNMITYVTGNEPEFLIYPYGVYNARVDSIINEMGYNGSVSKDIGYNYIDDKSSKFRLNTFNISEDTQLNELLKD